MCVITTTAVIDGCLKIGNLFYTIIQRMAVVCVDQHNFLLADRIVARSCPHTHRDDA